MPNLSVTLLSASILLLIYSFEEVDITHSENIYTLKKYTRIFKIAQKKNNNNRCHVTSAVNSVSGKVYTQVSQLMVQSPTIRRFVRNFLL